MNSLKTIIRSFSLVFALTIVCLLGIQPSAFAQSITYPYGYFTGDQTAASPIYYNPFPMYYTVSAIEPVTAMPWATNITVESVLGAQGINATNGWTINRFTPTGTFRLDINYAWTETAPAVTQGDQWGASSYVPGYGGIVFGLHYTPGSYCDPQMHWIQIIHTNMRNPNKGEQNDGNSVWYVDNNDNPNGDPFYDTSYTADPTDFADRPTRGYRNDSFWRGYLFLAHGNLGTKELEISWGGVYYGFDDPIHVVAVPEPSSIACLSVVAVLVLVYAMRKSSVNDLFKVVSMWRYQ